MNMAAAPAPRVLLHAFSTFKLGGPQARFVQLANALGPGYRHLVTAMDQCFDAGHRLDAAVDWRPVRMDVVKGGALANRGAFRAMLQRVQPDLLVSYNWGAIEWAVANMSRLCAQVHVEDGFGPEEAERQLPRRVWMRRLVLGMTRTPVVVASRNLEKIAVDTWRLPARHVHFLPNGVPLPQWDAARDRAAAEREPVRVGTVAGLRPEKNLARLIRAFAQVRARQPATLTIVGGGPLHDELALLTRTLGVADSVTFTGYLESPASALAQFDLFALSSDTEQLPIAMLEAMAAGIPVVATRVGDIPAILSEVSPDYLAAADDESFSTALRRAIDTRSTWAARAAAGQKLVRDSYSQDQMLARWRGVFNGELHSRNGSIPSSAAWGRTG